MTEIINYLLPAPTLFIVSLSSPTFRSRRPPHRPPAGPTARPPPLAAAGALPSRRVQRPPKAR